MSDASTRKEKQKEAIEKTKNRQCQQIVWGRLLERGWRKRIVRYLGRSHKIHFIERKATGWIYMVLERLTRKQTTSRPDTKWPEIWNDVSHALKRKEKQKWAFEKPKLDNARRFRGIYFIDPKDGDIKDIMKNARRKLEVPMPAAMPCKLEREKYRETCRVVKDCKTKYACIVEADESTRKRMDGSHHHNHEDHIVGKGINPLCHYNLVHNFIPMPQELKKNQMQKQQWRENGTNSRKTLLSEKPSDGYMWSGEGLTKRQATSRPDDLWPELWRGMARNAKPREKHKWAIEKPKLDSARRLRGIYFIYPEDKEFKETITNAGKKIGRKNKHGETRSKTNDFKSKLACVLEAGESTRLRMEESLPNYHEDHIAGRGDNSLQHYNLVHKFIPRPQAMKIPAAKAAVEK